MAATASVSSALQSQYASSSSSVQNPSGDLGKDAFLKLLTTQLSNQDPSSPMENSAFVAQLAQFSSLEQMTSMSSSLKSVYLALESMNNTSMSSLLGKHVVAMGDGLNYAGSGPVALHFDAAAATASTTLTVKDEYGTVVYSGAVGAVAAGEGSVSWDGNGFDGRPVPAGSYTFALTGLDSSGGSVDLTTEIEGAVDEMDYTSGSPTPSVDGVSIALSDILRITNGS